MAYINKMMEMQNQLIDALAHMAMAQQADHKSMNEAVKIMPSQLKH